jgi:hypothetical protein
VCYSTGVAWYKILFKGGGVLTQVADVLINPDEAGYGSDVVRALDESVGEDAFLRKLHVVFKRTATPGEDVKVVTFHLAKNVSGEPSTNWVTADFVAAEARFGTWWTALKPFARNNVTLDQYRWYKAGPGWPISGPPVRITSVAVAGTGASNSLPPQCAIDVSEHTRVRKHWGRFYLPLNNAGVDANGRVHATTQDAVHLASVALYNGLRADSIVPVVWSKAKPARTTKHGIALPPQPARAYAVEALKTDDIFDVIRSRRFDNAVTTSTTVLT